LIDTCSTLCSVVHMTAVHLWCAAALDRAYESMYGVLWSLLFNQPNSTQPLGQLFVRHTRVPTSCLQLLPQPQLVACKGLRMHTQALHASILEPGVWHVMPYAVFRKVVLALFHSSFLSWSPGLMVTILAKGRRDLWGAHVLHAVKGGGML
jgi:hypothetical protein